MESGEKIFTMRFDLKQIISDSSVLSVNYLVRDGYVFSSWNDNPNVFDVLVVRHPNDAVCNTQNYPDSSHPLSEYVRLIREENIERAIVIADDISFLKKCPSLRKVSVYPENSAKADFDYSPLYDMQNIKSLNCQTIYGEKGEKSCSIDYSKIRGLIDLGVFGKGHLNYDSIDTLEKLWVSNIKKRDDLYQISHSSELKDLTILQCEIKSLSGVEQYNYLQSLDLSYNRFLNDISDLCKVGKSLRLLNIEGCAKIKDFSSLCDLTNLEHLSLVGSNTLPNLAFLHSMPKLKTFTFSMEVADGDLSACLKIPYVWCQKGKKWYNIKDKDLPKQKPTEPFKII